MGQRGMKSIINVADLILVTGLSDHSLFLNAEPSSMSSLSSTGTTGLTGCPSTSTVSRTAWPAEEDMDRRFLITALRHVCNRYKEKTEPSCWIPVGQTDATFVDGAEWAAIAGYVPVIALS